MRARRSTWLLVIATNIGLIAAGLAASELHLRSRPAQVSLFYVPDKELGWAPARNVSQTFTATDEGGTSYRIDFKTNPDGFREWGNPDANRPKILVVGDSFTGDPNSSNDEAYFGILKSSLDAEIFAVGGTGYGTLQELIMVQRYVGRIKPDILLLQFCANDFANNSIELEDLFIVRNQKNLRPYWVDDEIRYRNAYIYRFLYKHSHLFRNLDDRLMGLQFKYYNDLSAPTDPVSNAKAMDRAEAITATLLHQMAASVGLGSRLATFNCNTGGADLTDRWIRVATSAGFLVWPEISGEVEAQERQGKTLRTYHHWSPAGHRIVAAELTKRLQPLLQEIRAHK